MGRSSNKKYKGFCVVPFIHMHGSEYKPCCVYDGQIGGYGSGHTKNLNSRSIHEHWQSVEYQDMRREFYKGKLPAGCNECAVADASGHDSKRTYSNEQFPRETEYYYNNETLIPPVPIDYDFRLSHYCNLECVMCGPHSSSAIEDRVNQNVPWNKRNKFPIAMKKYNKRPSVDYINYLKQNIDKVQRIMLAGGEPFLMPEVNEFVKWLYETNNSSHIDIRFLTNGTVFRSKWIDYLSSFKSTSINISLDGTGKILEYVRFPNKWNNVKKNLKLYAELNKHNNTYVSLNPTVHTLNLQGLHTVIRTAKQFNLKVRVSAVELANDHDYLRLGRLKQHMRDHEAELMEKELETITIKDQAYGDKENIKSFINRIRKTKFNLGKHGEQFKTVVKYWDTHKPKFLDVYPHLSYLLD